MYMVVIIARPTRYVYAVQPEQGVVSPLHEFSTERSISKMD